MRWKSLNSPKRIAAEQIYCCLSSFKKQQMGTGTSILVYRNASGAVQQHATEIFYKTDLEERIEGITQSELASNEKRFEMYRSYALMRHGSLGRGVRIRVP